MKNFENINEEDRKTIKDSIIGLLIIAIVFLVFLFFSTHKNDYGISWSFENQFMFMMITALFMIMFALIVFELFKCLNDNYEPKNQDQAFIFSFLSLILPILIVVSTIVPVSKSIAPNEQITKTIEQQTQFSNVEIVENKRLCRTGNYSGTRNNKIYFFNVVANDGKPVLKNIIVKKEIVKGLENC